MGIFDDLDSAPMPSGSSSNHAEGVYVVEINRCKEGESGKGKGPYAAIEDTVLETLVSYPPRTSWIDGKALPASNVPGEQCSQLIMMRYLSSPANLKGFCVAATGLPPGLKMPDGSPMKDAAGVVQTWKEIGQKIFGGDGKKLAGTKLLLRCYIIKTQSAGKPFTVHEWSRYSEENVAKLRELAAEQAAKIADNLAARAATNEASV